MSKPLVNGSAEWLIALREGAFSHLKPIPWEPQKRKPTKDERRSAAAAQAASAQWWQGAWSLIHSYNGKPCPYCGEKMGPGRKHPTRDHIFPRRLGGTRDHKNILIVCRPCNGDKGGMTLEQFAQWLSDNSDSRASIVWPLVTKETNPAASHDA